MEFAVWMGHHLPASHQKRVLKVLKFGIYMKTNPVIFGSLPDNYGVYRHNGQSFDNFHKDKGVTSNAIQCTFEDKEGNLWLGGYMGLFRYDEKSFDNITKYDL